MTLSPRHNRTTILVRFFCACLVLQGQTWANDSTNLLPSPAFVLPQSVPDPIEPFNRVMWGFNVALMTDVIQPTSRVYRFIVVKPVRTGIGNFGRNLIYPGRLINNLLQGKWNGARDESYRFLCNTTVGVVGFFDVGTRWKIPKSDADFGQTFGQWGWKPSCFVMLPFFGPSNERDTLGLAADTAANPLLYISPYGLVADDPLTYLGPYSYFTYADMYNSMADSVGEYVRFSQADRYVAINTPVRLLHGISKLDEFYEAPLDWPAAERTDDLENTFLKVAALSHSTLTPQTSLPFDAVESKFLIGLNFRMVLRDIIFSSQRRNNQGVLRRRPVIFRREPVYQEILKYSYQNYFDKFVIPYYQTNGLGSAAATALAKAGDLRTYESGLRANPDLKIIVNENDFLLADEDLAWLKATFSPAQLTVFKQGGHLGNLSNATVQKTILDGLSGLKPRQSQ